MHQAPTASGEVIVHARQVELEVCEVDHIQIGTVARGYQSAIIQSDPLCRGAGLTVHDVLNGNAWAPCSVADPMGQHRGGERAITDHADVRAAV